MTDQPKPLTDEELDEIEEMARADVERGTYYETPTPDSIVRLVAEVRRLRVVVKGAADLAVGSDAWCRGCHRTLIDQEHGPGCPIGALEAEAGEGKP